MSLGSCNSIMTHLRKFYDGAYKDFFSGATYLYASWQPCLLSSGDTLVIHIIRNILFKQQQMIIDLLLLLVQEAVTLNGCS